MTPISRPERVLLDNEFGFISDQRILCHGRLLGEIQSSKRSRSDSVYLPIDQVISVRLTEQMNRFRGLLIMTVIGGGVSSAAAIGSGAWPLGALLILLADMGYKWVRDHLVLEPEVVITTQDSQPLRIRGQVRHRQEAIRFVERLQEYLRQASIVPFPEAKEPLVE